MTESTEDFATAEDGEEEKPQMTPEQRAKFDSMLEEMERVALDTLSEEAPPSPPSTPKKQNFPLPVPDPGKPPFPKPAIATKRRVPNFKKTPEQMAMEVLVKTPRTPEPLDLEPEPEETSFDFEEKAFLGGIDELDRDRLSQIARSFILSHLPTRKKKLTNASQVEMQEKAERIREVARMFVDEYPPPPDFRESRALKILALLKELTFGWHPSFDDARGELPPHPVSILHKIQDLTKTWKDLKKTHHEVRKDWTDYCLKLQMNCLAALQGGNNVSVEDRVTEFIQVSEKAHKAALSELKAKGKGKGKGAKK